MCGIIVNNHSNVGIDIMSLDRTIDKSIINDVFTSQEINNNKDLIRLWCLKESYLKAIGIGLNYDLKRLEFVIGNKILLYIDKILQNEYNFDIFTVQNYIIAVTTTAGFEPARAMPNGFQVHLLNHSDTLSDFLDNIIDE